MKKLVAVGLLSGFAVCAQAAVSLSVTDRAVGMSNGIVRARFDADGRLRQLAVKGVGELLSNGGVGYFDFSRVNDEKNFTTGGAEFRVVRNSPDLAEIVFVKKMPDAEFELHYAMREGESGLYFFVVHRHTAAMPAMELAQKRFVIRGDPKFFTYAVASKKRHGPIPSPEAIARAETVQDATFRMADGAVYTKYDWAEFTDGHWGHGLCGTNAGLWMIFGSTEYFMGGPTKQELTVHQTETTPVALAMFTGEHFLGADARQRVEGDWAMLYGPVFIYVNRGGGPDVLYRDSSATARKLSAAWPYSWVNHPLFPTSRGSVAGRIKIAGGVSASNATVILAAPGQDWQVQWKNPVFSTHANGNGEFVLHGVSPGSYTLHSFVPGVLDELRGDGIDVRASLTNSLGEIAWTLPPNGKIIWQIGIPDRTAGEFRHGGEPRRYGLTADYGREFPHDVQFVIGQSRERNDWNFLQPAQTGNPKKSRGTTWSIRFNSDAALKGNATLSIAIAGCDMSPVLEAFVNGTSIAKLTLHDDGSIRRSATLAGRYELHSVKFDASLIKAGENIVWLRVSNNRPGGAVMYDCVRLEVAE